ncbi:MAG: DUF1015 domain-containing protein [Deltaproteobacteria bacterium]|nr:DUF1015 domain-containing protein [Deltaproteobacteria bacterium]
MSDIRPFPGLRPRPDVAAQVASPPYDVLNSTEARQMAAENPLSFLHVVKAEIDLPEDADLHGEAVYTKSAENLHKLIDEGVLIQDSKPCFYVYRLKMGEHVQHGLVVGASVDEYEKGLIKKHEFTRRAKEDDRARHVEVLQANAGPVLFTYKASDRVRDLVAGICRAGDATYDFEAADGVVHSLWVVDEAATIAEIQKAFAEVKALYVADGHHRTASAFRVRNIMRDKNPKHTGDEAYNHFLAVVFPDDELQIMGYNRVVRDLNGLDKQAFLDRVSEKFDLREDASAEPVGGGHFAMFLEGSWYGLVAKEGSFPADDPVRSLDAAILQENLLAPVLGVADPRSDERIDFVGGIRGAKELEKRCGEDMQVAFALYPVSVAQLMAIADADAVMPPKSTWFEPKLRSGLVVRKISD